MWIGGFYNGAFGLIHENSQHDELSPRILDATSIDYKLLRAWLDSCNICHGTMCQPQKMDMNPVSRVIDCESGNVVASPPNCKFVALSYVWGPSDPDADIEANACFPTTIQDSITVTKELGYKYLWVDRYCLEQENLAEKHRQLQTMDVVYSHAQLTIIAANGSNLSYGLPGVRSRPRICQKTLTIGRVSFVQIHDPDFSRLYPWSTRAWTYQEGLLPRRKLVFNDRGIFCVLQSNACRRVLQTTCDRYRP
ncbi:HET-domain-containing protein [Lentithecium fluviatile CBS 122367]|uniref:HET-domain-containing protein n=1 Tax=Lentithecium fluviatile CBS 122367 TaxID=1168545 RepID=A0A6G1IGF2_9PLEO|nr:HET-domain-containing protein [Lentithecium fluviatile CBS 122367]